MSQSQKNNKTLQDLNIDNISLLDEDNKYELIDVNHTYAKLYKNKSKRISRPILSKFEKTKILGIRAQQIASGAMPLIDLDNTETSAYEITMKEFLQKKTPFIIRRYLPNNKYEDWKLSELIY